jgi:tetratricopeptide (TPR) repeat protein
MIADIEERLAERRSPRLVNRLGTIYARYGLMDEAETAVREASFADYVPALINMGNVSYINSDLQQAFVYYRRAERLSPDDPEVLIGIARTQFEMEQYEEARENIELARLIDPAAAVPFAYITGGNTDSARASNAQKRDVMSWSE